jgi:hypothetical protein
MGVNGDSGWLTILSRLPNTSLYRFRTPLSIQNGSASESRTAGEKKLREYFGLGTAVIWRDTESFDRPLQAA